MLDVLLVSPEKIIFEGKATSVVMPGEEGVLEVLSYHRPLLSRLITGKIFIDNASYGIRRGIVGINSNKATIIVEEQ